MFAATSRMGAIIFLLAATVASPAPAAQVPQDLSDVVAPLLGAVVNISINRAVPAAPASGGMDAAARPTTKTALGSGFIIDPSGIVLTNRHVVEGAFAIMVTLSDDTEAKATLVGATRHTDLALLKINLTRKLPTVRFGDSDRLRVGDPVVAIGNPLGFGHSVSAGIVSALNRDIMLSPYDDFIQTDAAINHGNSGGPLFNMKGEVIGMNTALVSSGETTGSVGLGFSIPSNHVKFLVDQVRRYGRIRPGDMGMTFQHMTTDMAQAVGLPEPRGGLVSEVVAGGPADRAGIQIGDVVLKFGTANLRWEVRELARMIATAPLGETVPIVYWRDGHEHATSAVIAEWQGEELSTMMATPPAEFVQTDQPLLGLQLSAVGDESKAGVLVSEVKPHSASDNRGLRPGDVIVRVERDPVTSPNSVAKLVDAARSRHRDFVMVLVRSDDTPRWVALPLH